MSVFDIAQHRLNLVRLPIPLHVWDICVDLRQHDIPLYVKQAAYHRQVEGQQVP